MGCGRMDFLTLFFIAVGLSMDAMAVAISNGLCFKELKKSRYFLMAFSFGFFQGIMPIIGYFAGKTFRQYITSVDHWIALILLGIIGGKMVYEAIAEMRRPLPEHETQKTCSIKLLFVQSVATSIDALAVGVGFAVLDVNIYLSAGIIAATTFVCSLLGVLIGKKFGPFLKDKAQLLGGVILIGIGVKIFLEHILG